jgi:2-dehydropantoate 2-reductase
LAESGQAVTFLARGDHLKAIQQGLQVKSVHGDFALAPANATDDLSSVGPVDLALICVKDYQLINIMPSLPAIISDDTVILPLLNGVRAAMLLAEAFGRQQTMGGLCRIVSFVAAPGVIEQRSPFRSTTFGEWNGERSARAQIIYDVMMAADIDVTLVYDIQKAMWTKFIFISAYSGVVALLVYQRLA